MWTIRGLINELDTVVIQKFSQNRLKKETVVKAAIIIHHDKMTTELNFIVELHVKVLSNVTCKIHE